MNDEDMKLLSQALWLMLSLSAPPIIAASLTGLIVSILQSVTQIQEQTLQYALKFLAIVIALYLTFGVAATALYNFGLTIFSELPRLVRQ